MPSNEQIVHQALCRIEAAIRRRLAQGDYDRLEGPALCEAVTSHLQEACPDTHLRLLWVDEAQSLEPGVDVPGGGGLRQGVSPPVHRGGTLGAPGSG